MKNFISGLMVGLVLSGSAVLAQNIYDREGRPAAPHGSIGQYDYFRNRQQQLDVQALRKEADRQRVDRNQRRPCE